MAPSVRIVVVNWNSGDQLRACVASVAASERDGLQVELVVVDNQSTDGSCSQLDTADVPVKVLQNTRNEGFARACNQGAAGADTTYLLFLNPDARLDVDSLKESVRFLASPAGAPYGAIGVQLYDDEGRVHRSCARFPSARHFVVRALGLERALGGRIKGLELKEFDHLSSRDVDHVMGAFLLVRRSAFDEVGGFDEGYFLYLEDLDLSLRLARAGWKTRFLATTRAYHRGGGTSGQVRGRRQAYWSRARMRYARKHLSTTEHLVVAGTVLTLEPALRLAYALAAVRLDEARAQVESYRLVLHGMLRGDEVFRGQV